MTVSATLGATTDLEHRLMHTSLVSFGLQVGQANIRYHRRRICLLPGIYPYQSTRQLAANGGMPEEALFLPPTVPVAVPQG